MNRLRHGLYAEDVIVPQLDESKEHYEDFRQVYLEELKPKSLIQYTLAEQYIYDQWRLRRIETGFTTQAWARNHTLLPSCGKLPWSTPTTTPTTTPKPASAKAAPPPRLTVLLTPDHPARTTLGSCIRWGVTESGRAETDIAGVMSGKLYSGHSVRQQTSMGSETDLFRLASMAYEAATEPEMWPEFLERYARAVNAEFAFLHLHDYAAGRSRVIAASTGLALPLQQSYHDYYSKLNLWRDRCQSLARTGSVILEEEICPRALTTSSEFYNDYLLRVGATRSMSVIISRVGQQALSIPPMRKDNDEPFNEENRDFLRRLLPHLARANLIRERLAMLQAGQEVLDQLALGIAFLTAECELLYANRAAEAMIRKEDGFVVRGGRLRAQQSEDDEALCRGIRGAASPEHAAAWPRPVLIRRPTLLRGYQVLLAPIRGQFPQFRGARVPSVIAMITDPERNLPVLPALLEYYYGLTRREAAVAAKLADGVAVEELAKQLGIRYETARTHLRRIYEKTGTSRQSELVSLVARMRQHQPE